MSDAGVIVWFTGLPQSGKSTLARRVRDRLAARRACIVLDSDDVRDALEATRYEATDRDAFYRILGRLAAMLAAQGHVVLVAATAPLRRHRETAQLAGLRYLEVWVNTPLADCEARDTKQLYARARAGDAQSLPGIGAAYEEPHEPAVTASGGYDDAAAAAIDLLVA